MNKLKRTVQLLLVAFVLMDARAFSQIMQTMTFTLSSASPAGTLTFNQFNAALGTLQSVDIDYSGVTVTGTGSLTNGNPTARTFNFYLAGIYSVTDSGGTFNANVNVNSVNFNGSINSGATQSVFINGSTPGNPGSSSTAFTDPATLTAFTGGTGTTITLDLSDNSDVDVVTGPGTHNETETDSANGSLEVIYNYTPVPEPAQTASWLLGFGVCLFIGRKYFRRTALLPQSV